MPDLFYFDRSAMMGLAQAHHAEYEEAAPFPHVVIDDFLPPDVLVPVLEEFPEEPADGWRRRDEPNERKLSLSDEAKMGVATRHLIQQFNSQVFMQFLEVLTGISGLIPDPYLIGGGLHKIVAGGLLKVHVDFNRHRDLHLDRRLNLLLYLNPNWEESYGGCLELWDPSMTSCLRRVLPIFNRCVIFATGETSYHGHPEPLTCPEDRARRSMALYYYSSSDAGSEAVHTTLFQARPGEALAGPPNRNLARRFVPPVLLDAGRKFQQRRTGGRKP